MSQQPNRRDVLKAAAAAGVGYWVSGSTARTVHEVTGVRVTAVAAASICIRALLGGLPVAWSWLESMGMPRRTPRG